MAFASIALDIPTRFLEGAFDYRIPEAICSEVQIGTTVLVPFSGRGVVGYVVDVKDELAPGLNPSKVKDIECVLAPSAFDKGLAELAFWMSEEYAAPLCDCLRLMIAPGQKVKVVRADKDSPWELVCEKAKPVDDRWVMLTPEGESFEPIKSASRQRELISALKAGPCKMVELTSLIGGVSSVVKTLQKKGVVRVESTRRVRTVESTSLSSANAQRPETLTDDQKRALSVIDQALQEAHGSCVVVDGVTGSGKTEVYLRAIEQVRAQGKGVIVLVPEISLTAQTVGRFRSRFGDSVAILHSRLSVGERFDQWDMVRKGKANVVVGARSALFAPMKNPGIIIIDEEHEISYKQDQSPRYHARETAAKLAQIRNCALVLGSATPSLESLHRCEEGRFLGSTWQKVEMHERPGIAKLPSVQIVDMANQFVGGNHSIFSTALREALDEVVETRKKAVLLLNRRGFANFLMCRECGCVPECPHCATSLTYHERTHSLMCHSCGRTWPQVAYPNPATKCPNCGSIYLAQFGAGTQRVEDELKMLVGDSCEVIRMDWDTTRTKGAHQKLLEEFDAAECAVLIGTQMIAKGLDFPEVTLVGVINADTTLKLPDFRAPEKTYHLLEQVAGRAGRGEDPGKVIVQTYWASHPSIQAVKRHDRTTFLLLEMADRMEANYPPYSRLVNVVMWGSNKHLIESYAGCVAEQIRTLVSEQPQEWQVLGPVECIKSRIKDKYRFHIMIKAPVDASPGPLVKQAFAAVGAQKGVSTAIDVDAYDLM